MPTKRMFDQMVEDNNDKVPADIRPNKRILGEVIFEPLASGIRISGRGEKHELLWGMVCTKLMLDQPHASIAIYEELRKRVRDALAEENFAVPETTNTVESALKAIDRLEALLAAARKKITVKKVSAQTKSRATAIYNALHDAYQLLSLELPFSGTSDTDD